MTLSAISYHVERFGVEQEPILVIDNYTESIGRLLRRAHAASYKATSAYYPGVQAPEDSNYLGMRGADLMHLMRTIFDVKGSIEIESCNYALVCRPRDKLESAQCLPHFDANDPLLFASVHYIQAHESAGTAFYKHRKTGFETITENRKDIYKEALQNDFAQYGPPPKNYFYGSDERYEKIGEISAKPDRLILYRGCTLHSGCISEHVTLTPDKDKARITLNSFLWDRPNIPNE